MMSGFMSRSVSYHAIYILQVIGLDMHGLKEC